MAGSVLAYPTSQAVVGQVEALYRENHAFVWRNARRLGAQNWVDDAVHEVFLVATRRLHEFEGRASAKTWLFAITFRIVQRLQRDKFRQQRHTARAGSTFDSGGRSDSAGNAGSTFDSGGRSDSGGSAGSSSGGSLATDMTCRQAYGGSGGRAGGDVTGSAGANPACFAELSANTGDPAPSLGPQNAVFIDVHPVAGRDVKNYSDQMVFGETGVWETYANFPASELAKDKQISLPTELSRVPNSLGQVYITRPSCAGTPAAGHKLTVEVWWKLGGAIGEFPTEGFALGTVSQNKPVWFCDTVRAFVLGDSRVAPLNTLNRLVIEHVFAGDDATDAGKITLGLWLLSESNDFPSTFYIGKVKWD